MDEYEARAIVGRWLRIRAEHIRESIGIAGWPYLSSADQEKVLLQLAADAEHSDLLTRLFRGEEPLPFEEWKNR